MNGSQREQVRSNAKYLRNVRPLDPDEISEYVEGRPHPAAVRQVLRESAVALDLIEREDGTFVPVESGAVTVEFDGVTALPERYGSALTELLVERYGADWEQGDTGDEIREHIRTFKADYLQGAPVEYDADTALAYAVYHLPGYYAAAQYVLSDLADDGLLPRRLRVLDVGAGVGGPALGLCDLLPDDALVDYHAVEPSEAVEVLEPMLAETERNVHTTIHRSTAESFDPQSILASESEDGVGSDESGNGPDHGFDLILFSNVLSELDDPEAVLRDYESGLAEDGTVVALAPADRNTAIGLRETERAVADRGPYDVYAPTVRLWAGESPSDECWSFDVRPDLEVPAFQRRIDDAASGPEARPREFVNVDVQFAYSLLRRDGRRRYELSLDASHVARFADAESHVTNRVDCFAAKLSRDLSDDGNPLFLLGDGSQRVSHFAVLTKESALNRNLLSADYGEVLGFENVLVLWNDDEQAYNLVVDGETVVDRVPR